MTRKTNIRAGGSERIAGGHSPFSLHIERLVIDGVPLTAAQGAQFQSALEQELGRLVEEGGQARVWRGLGAVAALQAAPIELGAPVRPVEFGRLVARRVFASLQPDA